MMKNTAENKMKFFTAAIVILTLNFIIIFGCSLPDYYQPPTANHAITGFTLPVKLNIIGNNLYVLDQIKGINIINVAN